MRASGWLLLAGALLAAPAQAASCRAVSGPQTAALVELYTSQGCSSCPPAERWLGTLEGGGRVVPLALHVDYWDDLGWRDPYARHAFTLRQRRLARLAGAAFVYTPQVLLQGRDFRGWSGRAFGRAVARINATPARAALELTLDAVRAGAVELGVRARLLPGAARATDPALYLATYQSGLADTVGAGENRGRRLRGDYVVRAWLGPVAFGRRTRLDLKRRLAPPPGGPGRRWGVAAFVQDRATAQLLQALMLPACAR